MSTNTLMTADQLLKLPRDGVRRELVKGVLVEMSPSGFDHGTIALTLATLLNVHVRAGRLGKVAGTDTGFRLQRDPDTVRAPDVAFVAKDRLPSSEESAKFPSLAPDLVAEVVSPSDRSSEVEAKVQEYLDVGVRLVWIVHPKTRTVTEYRSRDEVRVLTENDHLDGFDVVPGFQAPIKDLFD